MLSDDTKIIRFLDQDGLKKSLGRIEPAGLHFTFHFGFLSQYRNDEESRGDSQEGSVSINLNNNHPAKAHMGSDALVSCWSIYDSGELNPWEAFRNGSHANNPDNKFVIVSTVGKVRKIVQAIFEINSQLNNNLILGVPCHDLVKYVPLSEKEFHEKTDLRNVGGDGLAYPKLIIFSKRPNDGKGKSYISESEYRFALILNTRRFSDDFQCYSIDAKNLVQNDYKLISCNCEHYITEVHFLSPLSQELNYVCWKAGIVQHLQNIPSLV
jgi:hypothetical protein